MQKTLTDFSLKMSVWLLCYPQISQEEALLAVAVFPAIRELDICSNPLTTQRISNSIGALFFSSSPLSCVTSFMSPAGGSPSLTQLLQHRLGIAVKSHFQPVTNLPLRQSEDPKQTVRPGSSQQPPEFTKSLMVYSNNLFFYYFRLGPVSVEGCTGSSWGW